MSLADPEATTASPPPTQKVGIGRVLSGIRQPGQVREPHCVEFRDATKTFHPGRANEFTAIRNVRFVVEDLVDKGEFICILGPSGCGKSTILRLIAGLRPQHPPTSGQVLVMGRPVTGPGADRGMVFQDYTSFDHRTVLDNVSFGLECQGVPRRQRYEHARRWIARVGLDVAQDLDKYPHELSGGMRQRVAIARTLILHPRIILMDEPFGALDPMTRMTMQDLVLELWRTTQATVFFVTHSIEEAVFLGDRIYVVSNSPGTILHELTIEPSDRPSKEMQREEKFQQTVYYLRDLISQLEESAPRRHLTRPDLSLPAPPFDSGRTATAVGLGKYIKKAFLFHWNLLAFLGGMGFALISGHPDVVMPLVVAGETAYLGFLGTHPRFQKYVDAQEHKSARAQADALAVVRMQKSLPAAARRRFEALRDRCLALRQIAQQLRAPDGADSLRPLEELQLSDLDRLLWMYLRMLYTQHMLQRFFESTSGDQIQAEIKRIEDRIKRLEKEPDSANRARIRQSLETNLETGRSRLANLTKARENHELLQVEIENLETKIQSITEMAINRSDADSISGQVEQISQGLIRTEQTINDLGFATGVEPYELTVPSILPRDVAAPEEVAEEPPPRGRQRENEIRFQ